MAELSLKQIADKLNTEFAGDTRKIVFWYDDAGDFAEDIDRLELANAKIRKLTGKNQFRTKMLLEREDRESNYLIYAPFSKPDIAENHLEDIMLYSKRFYADRASLITVDLGLPEELKPVIEQHIKFFGSKDRLQRFYALAVDVKTEESLRIVMMCVLAKVKVASFDELLRAVLTSGPLQENPAFIEFSKYDLLPAFWKGCGQRFGYQDKEPTLTRLTETLFLTTAGHAIRADLPPQWQPFLTDKAGSCITFLDSLMNNVQYQEGYDRLSDAAASDLQVKSTLQELAPEAIRLCDTFRCVDELLIRWILGRLLAEDVGARLDDKSLTEIFAERRRMHYGSVFASAYTMLEEALYVIAHCHYEPAKTFDDCVEQYQQTDYAMDASYRHFYVAYDTVINETEEDSPQVEALRELVETIYTNEYLGHQLPAWNETLAERGNFHRLTRQLDFYRQFVQPKKEKTVVIISDALRYEVGQELWRRLSDDERYQAKLASMIAVLPSYTRLGMLALLPHQTVDFVDRKELVDGRYVIDLAGRREILQAVQPASDCVQFDDIRSMKKADLRKIFTGKQVVYVYHDRVDNMGESSPDAVFSACETAIREIMELIQRLTVNANTQHFIVTADHGFIYKRDAADESDKIGGVSDKNSVIKRRYIVSAKPVKGPGICSLPLSVTLNHDNSQYVSYPLSHNVFKAPGGLNYVHGGSSPQELLIPMIEVRSEKNHTETRPAVIALITHLTKITNLITSIEFVQSEPVSDVVKPVTYSLYFVDKDDQMISNVETYQADSRDPSTANRIAKKRFTFTNQIYDRTAKYYLVVKNQETGMILLRHEVRIDLAFAGDFGF